MWMFHHRASNIKNRPQVNKERSVEVLEALLAESAQKSEEQAKYIEQLQAEIQRLSSLLSPGQSTALGSSQEIIGSRKGKEKDDSGVVIPFASEDEELYSNDEHFGELRMPQTIRSTTEGNGSVTIPFQESSTFSSPQRTYNYSHHHSQSITKRELLHLLCPLTRRVFSFPVVCQDGYTYERDAISAWLRKHRRSPVTGNRLLSKELIPNYQLKKMIADRSSYDPVFSTFNYFSVLPFELVGHIFQFLDAISLLRCSKVSSHPLRETFTSAVSSDITLPFLASPGMQVIQ